VRIKLKLDSGGATLMSVKSAHIFRSSMGRGSKKYVLLLLVSSLKAGTPVELAELARVLVLSGHAARFNQNGIQRSFSAFPSRVA
jgi:hypothetical protein